MSIVQRLSKSFFYLALFPAVIVLSAWQGWSWWSWATAPPVPKSSPNQALDLDKTVQISIPPGSTSKQIGTYLESAGLIRSSNAWDLWARWLNTQNKAVFKAGTYQLSPTQSLVEIAEQISKGSVVQLSFTIPEGRNLKQMAAYFESQGFFSAQEFLAATKQIPRDRFPWLPSGLPHLEGFLYPDTYQIASGGITPKAIINIMLKRFEEVALPIYQQNPQESKMNLLQWVTLASIVEKEAVIPKERPRIAGVFTQRLQKGMRLEADPTVEYGLNIQQTADQPLTFKQVRTPSPYNTYLNRGLPPTPIASPGKASLQATLTPEKTDYLFFVARYDGTHVFSRTLAEHETAVAAIRRQRVQQSQQANPQPN